MPALSSLPDASIYANAQAPQAMSLQNLVDLGRSSTALQREKALLQPSIAKGVAESETAVTGAESAKAKLHAHAQFFVSILFLFLLFSLGLSLKPPSKLEGGEKAPLQFGEEFGERLKEQKQKS
jgi:thiol:disulfide interchange protein